MPFNVSNLRTSNQDVNTIDSLWKNNIQIIETDKCPGTSVLDSKPFEIRQESFHRKALDRCY